MITMNPIEEIKRNFTVTSLLRSWGVQVRDGNQLIRSPLREDRSPSFSIYDNGRRWKDFGTDEGGDVIDLVAKKQNCSVTDAISMLAGELGIDPQVKHGKDLRPAPSPPKVRPQEDMKGDEPWVYDEQAMCFMDQCKGQFFRTLEDADRYPPCLELLIGTKKFKRMELIRLLTGRGLQLGEDAKGNLIYFMPFGLKSRGDVKSSRGDRWINGKSRHNLFVPILYPDTHNVIVLTEGETDALSAVVAFDRECARNMPLVLGCQGASTLPSRKTLYPYMRGEPKVVICFDNDKPGMRGAAAMHGYLKKEFDIDAKLAQTKEKDLSLELQRHGANHVIELLSP